MFTRRRTIGLLGSSGLLFVGGGLAQSSGPALPQPDWDAVTVEDAVFESQGVTLRGDFVAPKNRAARAGLVMIHGAGPEPRMTGLAAIYATAGYAVLSWDKRGAGESGGVYEGADNVGANNLALLAADAAAGMQWTAQQAALASAPLGFAGFSQAGWIAPLALSQGARSDFLVMWSGPVAKVSEALAFEALGGNPDPALSAYIERIRSDGDVDSETLIRALDIPGFWIWGGRDDIVPVDISRERLSVMIAGGRPFEHTTLPDMGHRLMEREIPPTLAWLEETLGV